MDCNLLSHITDWDEFLSDKTADEKRAIYDYLKAVEKYKKYNKMEFFKPEQWQRKAIKLGAEEDFRMVCAGNRLGKTYFATYEASVHATGKYPDDWEGVRFNRPINTLVMGWDWTQLCRPKATQELMIGKADERGSGWIPKSHVVKMVPKVGLQNTISTVFVKHYDEHGIYDGDSRITFDVYSAGMGTLMGTEVDFALLDEQVPIDIFSQIKKRLWSSRGSCLYVATPEKGKDEVIDQFWEETGVHHSGLIHVTLWDSTLFSEEEKLKMSAEIEPWARAFSIEGIPSAGTGAVFAGIIKDSLLEPDIEPNIKSDWKRLGALDLGYKDDMALTMVAKDPRTDTYYFYAEKGYTETDAINCASGFKPYQQGYIPFIIPADGDSNRGLGATYRSIFEGAGLKVLSQQARNWYFDDTGKSRDIKSGLVHMRQLMKEGRLKVHPSCTGFLKEFSLYSYDKEGKPVDKNNHYIDSLRYCLMAIDKFGVTEYEGKSNSHDNYQSIQADYLNEQDVY